MSSPVRPVVGTVGGRIIQWWKHVEDFFVLLRLLKFKTPMTKRYSKTSPCYHFDRKKHPGYGPTCDESGPLISPRARLEAVEKRL